MYGYIYDVFLTQKQYEKDLIQIENELTDLALNGHIIKLSIINNIGHAVQDMLRKGVKTIVAVGSDQLFSKLIDQIDDIPGVTLGLIPLGNHQQLARLFGIPEGVAACRTISARFVKQTPLAKINNAYFIHSLLITEPQIKIECHGQFVASATSEQALITIYNLHSSSAKTLDDAPKFTVVISPSEQKKLFKKYIPVQPTIIKSPKIKITHAQTIPIVVDGQKIINTPASLSITNKQASIIMGKERQI